VGSLKATLRDRAGKALSSGLLPLGVYYTLEPRFSIPISGVPAGRYELSVEAVSSRPDLPADMLLATVPIRRSVEVLLP
jgi:hypothetical protein